MEQKSKFNIINPRRNLNLDDEEFHKWDNQHIYRTQAGDMTKRGPSPNREKALPGYTGYIPTVKSENHFGKSKTECSRNALNRTFEQTGQSHFAVSGQTLKRLKDQTMQFDSHKFGKQTTMPNHPCQDAPDQMTTSMTQYQSPQKLTRPTSRSKSIMQSSRFRDILNKDYSSGYTKLSKLNIGESSNNWESEYSQRMNVLKPLRRERGLTNDGRVKRRPINIDDEISLILSRDL